MPKNKLFMVGGAKGVGKSELTKEVARELSIERMETGAFVLDYLKNPPKMALTDYLVGRILSATNDILLDTHFAEYPIRGETSAPFKRGLESPNLAQIASAFNVDACLIEVMPEELLRRRRNHSKLRRRNPTFILEELEYNRRAYGLYVGELGITPCIIINDKFEKAKDDISAWVMERYGK